MIKHLIGIIIGVVMVLIQPVPSALASMAAHSFLTGVVQGFTETEISVTTDNGTALSVARKLINESVDLRPGIKITFLYDSKLVKIQPKQAAKAVK